MKHRVRQSTVISRCASVKFRVCVERGRPFLGVAAAKQSVSSIMDPKNTAQLEQHSASSKTEAVKSKKLNPGSTTDAENSDVEKVLMRLSSSVADPDSSSDPTDCMAILRSFQVGL